MNEAGLCNGGCDTYLGLKWRHELHAALEQMSAGGNRFDHAVCLTYDGRQWEVQVKLDNIYLALPSVFPTQAAAKAAGEAWLRS